MGDSQREERIQIIDALRGFALAGILLVHMVEQFLGAQPSDAMMSEMFRGTADQVLAGLLEILVRGKFLALFSFLFGLSFFIQMDRATDRSKTFHGRFLWRITLLLIIGYAHSLFYRGDILTIYAMLGFLLVPFYAVRTRVLLAVAALLLLGAGRYAVFAISGGETIMPYGDFSPELPHNQAYYAALLSGSLLDVFASNAWLGHMSKLEFQVTLSGRLFLTFAFFLLGLWAGRVSLFEKREEWHGLFKRALWAGLAASVAFLGLTIVLFSTLSAGNGMPVFDSWHSMFARSSYDLFNLAVTVVILCTFVLAYNRPRGERFLAQLAPYGRTALTNYLLQTVIGTFVFYNWGLGYLGKLSNTEAFGIALVVLVLQVLASRWWLKQFRYGPVEWLWRSGTRLEWQPLAGRAVS